MKSREKSPEGDRKQKHEYQVGQEGEFPLRDAFGQPAGTVRGTIVSLLQGDGYFYLLVDTEQGVRPVQVI